MSLTSRKHSNSSEFWDTVGISVVKIEPYTAEKTFPCAANISLHGGFKSGETFLLKDFTAVKLLFVTFVEYKILHLCCCNEA